MKNTFSSLRRNHSASDLQVLVAPPAAPQTTGATSVPDNDSSASRLWNNLKHHQPSQPLEYYRADDVPWNDSGVQCVRNTSCLHVQTGTNPQSRVPMHAHVLPSSENAPAESIRYAAAQAPAGAQDAWTRTIIHALQSGQGVFQFVSTQAHRRAVSPRAPTNVQRKHPSILDELLQHKSRKDGSVNVRLGDRFVVTKVTPIVTEGSNVDHVQYLIEAEDIPGAPLPQRKYSTVLTQAGLPFTHAVLTPAAIVRASALLDAHQGETANIPSEQRTPVQDASQLIVSHAGIGRNATLIVYRDIVKEIDTGMVNRGNLDDTLCRIIAACRAIRGPRFIHSEPQLAALRAALWLLCPAAPKSAFDDKARRLFSVRQSAPGAAVGVEASGDTMASPAHPPRYATTLKRSRSMTSMLIGWRTQPSTPPNLTVAPPLPGDAGVAQATGTPALPDGFHQKIDQGNNCRFCHAGEVNGHYSNFWQAQPVVIDGYEYRTVEHYFHAQKYAAPDGASPDDKETLENIQNEIMAAETPGKTKNLANNKDNRPFAVPWETWKTAKIKVMYNGIYAKFSQDTNLKDMLLATEDAQLIETMPVNGKDTFWGVKDGVGTNMLGRILMRVRKDLRENRALDPNPNFKTEKLD